MIIISTQAMRGWVAEVSGDAATFTVPAQRHEGEPAGRWLPRVWHGRGLGLREDHLPGFRAAVAEVMSRPQYWREYWRARMFPVGERAGDWSPVRYDPDDDFTYIAGPCGRYRNEPGYRPTPNVEIPLRDLRGLRIRISSYLAQRDDPAPARLVVASPARPGRPPLTARFGT
jgi:hypothetical protein